jgi:hypothetical protein
MEIEVYASDDPDPRHEEGPEEDEFQEKVAGFRRPDHRQNGEGPKNVLVHLQGSS